MLNEQKDFADALEEFILTVLRNGTEPADYNNEAIEIVDARNHIFRSAGKRGTDEELNLYAVRDLCRISEDNLETVPDRMRLLRIAQECGLPEE